MAALVVAGKLRYHFDLSLSQSEHVIWERRWLFPSLREIERVDRWHRCIIILLFNHVICIKNSIYLEPVVTSDGLELFLKNLFNLDCV